MPDVSANMYDEAYADVPDDGSIEGLEATFVEVDGVTDRVDGVETRYYDYGDGDPLLLLHGGKWIGTSNANTWSRVIEGLSEYFRVLAVDRLGCGMTGVPDDVDDWVYEAELEHMLSFLETLDVDELNVAGQSRGGGFGGRIAVEIPDRVKMFIPVNSGSLAPTAPNKDFFHSRALRDAPADEDSPTYHADVFKHHYGMHEYSPHHVTDEYAMAAGYMRTRSKALRVAEVMENREHKERYLETVRENYSYTYHRIRQGDLQMPTLLYWGANDPSVPLTSGIALFELLNIANPRVYMEIVSRAGHHPYREYPEMFVDRVSSFVRFHEVHGYDYGESEISYDLITGSQASGERSVLDSDPQFEDDPILDQ